MYPPAQDNADMAQDFFGFQKVFGLTDRIFAKGALGTNQIFGKIISLIKKKIGINVS